MFATAPLLLALALPQGPDLPLAHYTLDGQQRTVTKTDVALEMAFHLRRRDRGRKGCDVLVDSVLTTRAAKKLDLMPTKKDVLAFWEKLKKQLREAGHEPEEFAAVRNTGEQQWLETLSIQIAQERLVRRELGLGESEQVSGDMLKLWLGEARKSANVETDPDKLPSGMAAKVDDVEIPLIDLGLLLLQTSEDFERDRFIQQVAYLESVESLAKKHKFEVTPSDLDAAIDKRRKDAQRDPRYRGVSFENLLEAQGLTVSALRNSRVFRAHLLVEKIATDIYTDAAMKKELADDRQQVLDAVGPRRRIGLIFVRALAKPNALIKRTFEQAEQHLLKVRDRIAIDGFEATATIESEESRSKKNGGDVGWHLRNSKQLPEAILKAAFAVELLKVSMPIRSKEGVFLVTTLEKDPDPSDEELIKRLRKLRSNELSDKLLIDADIKIVGKEPAKDPKK